MVEHPNVTIYEFLSIDASLKVDIKQGDVVELGTLTPGKYYIIPHNEACLGLLNCSTLFPLANLIYLFKDSYSALSFLQNCHITPHMLRSDVYDYWTEDGFSQIDNFRCWTDVCFPLTVGNPVMIPFDSELGRQLTRIAQGNSL